jgi:hypothetical protein
VTVLHVPPLSGLHGGLFEASQLALGILSNVARFIDTNPRRRVQGDFFMEDTIGEKLNFIFLFYFCYSKQINFNLNSFFPDSKPQNILGIFSVPFFSKNHKVSLFFVLFFNIPSLITNN